MLSYNCFKNIFCSVIQFTLAPENSIENLPVRNKIINSIILFFLKIILAFVVAITSAIIFSTFDIDVQNIGLQLARAEYSLPILLLLSGILFPLLEEIGFRLFLKFSPLNFALSLGVLSYYFLSKITYNTYIINTQNHFLERIVFPLILTVVIFFVAKYYKKELSLFWNSNFEIIFYCSVLAFGLVHLFNYNLKEQNLLIIPILILPQLISSTIYGYIRVRYGFFYNSLLHIVSNSIILIFSSIL